MPEMLPSTVEPVPLPLLDKGTPQGSHHIPLADRLGPSRMSNRRPWTLDACQQVMTAWVVTRYEAQSQEATDIAEAIIFDLRTGA